MQNTSDGSPMEFDYEGQHITLSFANPQDYIARVMRRTGTFYESDVLEAIRSALRQNGKSGAAIDAGAFIGTHSIYFARFCGCSPVLAFEANPRTMGVLTKNIAANGLTETIRPLNKALGVGSGRATMIASTPGNTGSSSVKFGTGEIEVISLDEITDLERISLLKIDVEGAELDVLRGARKLIAEHRPILCIEVHTARRLIEVVRMLAPVGYRIVDCLGASPTYIFESDVSRPGSFWRQEFVWLVRALHPRGPTGRLLRMFAKFTR